MRQSVLERIVEERVGQSLVGNVSTAIEPNFAASSGYLLPTVASSALGQ